MLPAYLLMCLVYGTTFLAIKMGLSAGFPPFLFAGVRFFVAGLMVLGLLRARGVALPRGRRTLGSLALIGAGNTFIPFACLYSAERFIPSGIAAMLTSTGPALVTLFLLALERRRPERLQWLGLGLGLLGVWLLVGPSVDAGSYGRATWVAAGSVLLAQVAVAGASVYSKRVLSRGVEPLAMNGFQMVFGSSGLLLLSLAFERGPLVLADAPRALGALAYLTVMGSMVASGIYFWLVKRTGPVFPSTWLYVSPMIALFLGSLALGEPLPATSLAGAVLVLGGVLLTNARLLFTRWAAVLAPRT
ncbi:EamA family transporter [Aggregicoccus sp. 17bor-14]|uniref:DMT family transporter n=1 Tax=Myxococcaceae TaxID=31 RepID=UPI00129C438B|nr:MULTISPECIES: EamA family transporter [Myxococcaceae]MBF5045087.1 EamA family transporter [Simulacricoccus sp. 17bor-14]MRI90829.1 EamA family transporter [Aggregicoccus sp. 17bor-14]